ncbi:hypothetical protein TEA_012221 [Camellia sinensis var. sinensis]|uniref:non-specific serine/threonine protein kinase n=1 Tax=Camellia sinensis var. sinensis TaxID=542762 RepID=A0A4S4E1L0_CAMSN|nr:hypothetical protein TEA_012221 [Camellia sinensis var. sinensis]
MIYGLFQLKKRKRNSTRWMDSGGKTQSKTRQWEVDGKAIKVKLAEFGGGFVDKGPSHFYQPKILIPVVKDTTQKNVFVDRRSYAEASKGMTGVGGGSSTIKAEEIGNGWLGVLPSSKEEVAIKKINHDSKQWVKEFVTEIASMGRGVAPALQLQYLHEEWEQVVLHRDVKASNVLLDADLNGQLGDFGLARLYDHGANPQTTHIVGTVGYLAPELTRTGKATTSTDVFAFGAFLLEVACGRRPVELQGMPEAMILVDWVLEKWKGVILEVSDPRLEVDYSVDEMDLVLKLGLLCSHSNPAARPSMWQGGTESELVELPCLHKRDDFVIKFSNPML